MLCCGLHFVQKRWKFSVYRQNNVTFVFDTILKHNLKQFAEKQGIKDTFELCQDNDPYHKAYKVRSVLLYNCPKVIEPPRQSPDMNPIENVWNELERRVHQEPVSSIAELKKTFVRMEQN